MISVFKNLSKKERKFFLAAMLFFFLFSLLLFLNSFFNFGDDSRGTRALGSVIETKNDVRAKQHRKFFWRNIGPNTAIHPGDSLFTGDESETLVRLNDGSEMLIRENSLVVFTMKKNKLDMNFTFGNVKILSGDIKVNGETVGKNQDVKITRGGKKEQATLPKQSQSERAVHRLPAENLVLTAPSIIAPSTGYHHVNEKTEDGPWKGPRIFKIRWTHPKPTSEFEIQFLERTEGAENIVKKQKLRALETQSPDLPGGNYLARVRQLSPDPRLTSRWSEPLEFSIEDRPFDPHLAGPILDNPRIQYAASDREDPHFSWQPVPNAGKYFFQLATDPQFTDAQETSFKSSKTEFIWKKFVRGKFYYRVYAATPKGTKGKPSRTGEITVRFDRPKIDPVEPLIVQGRSPDDQGDPQIFKITWTGLPAAEKYQVQVSKNARFNDPIELTTRAPKGSFQVPEPGSYLVRVRPLDKDGEPLTAFSKNEKVEYILRLPLATPNLQEPVENMTLFFQKNDPRSFWMEWKPVRQADSYTVQVATDPDFKNLLLEDTATRNRYLVRKRLPLGKLYWRVRAQGTDRVSFWSAARRMKVFAGKTAEIYRGTADEGR